MNHVAKLAKNGENTCLIVRGDSNTSYCMPDSTVTAEKGLRAASREVEQEREEMGGHTGGGFDKIDLMQKQVDHET
jgi:hypothetical protein